MWFIFAIIGIFVCFLSFVLLRAALFRPRMQAQVTPGPAEIDGERAIVSLQRMVQCRTVSSRDGALEDAAEFVKFQTLLQELYPRLHAACTREMIGKRGLLYHWKGKADEKPTVYMAHYDVVPAEEEYWTKPAFEGIRENGELWGRGTLDTKGTLCAALEAAEHLLERGFIPENDIYFSFGGDEEVAGVDAPAIVDALKARGIRPALVVDEGGAVVKNVFPGVKEPCALIGTSEKGMLDIEFQVKSKGGHASAPPPHTPVGILAQAVVKLENKPFAPEMTEPVHEMFDTLGRYSTFGYKIIFANLWCFQGILNAICKKTGGELNALMRTTCAFTMMKGSLAVNVLPPTASIAANMRLMGKDTIENAVARIKDTIGNDDISLQIIDGHNASPCTPTDSEGFSRVKQAVRETWPEAIVSPYLMVACSDSRHFTKISDTVLRFSAMELSNDDRKRIHGHDERIREKQLHDAVRFYVRLVGNS